MPVKSREIFLIPGTYLYQGSILNPREKNYTHELNNEVRSISGGYTLVREETIEIKGRKVLYAVGNAQMDTSCCGYWGCAYAVVPGYVLKWKYDSDDRGFSVSRVEPILDEDVKQDVKKYLQMKEGVDQVRFL